MLLLLLLLSRHILRDGCVLCERVAGYACLPGTIWWGVRSNRIEHTVGLTRRYNHDQLHQSILAYTIRRFRLVQWDHGCHPYEKSSNCVTMCSVRVSATRSRRSVTERHDSFFRSRYNRYHRSVSNFRNARYMIVLIAAVVAATLILMHRPLRYSSKNDKKNHHPQQQHHPYCYDYLLQELSAAAKGNARGIARIFWVLPCLGFPIGHSGSRAVYLSIQQELLSICWTTIAIPTAFFSLRV